MLSLSDLTSHEQNFINYLILTNIQYFTSLFAVSEKLGLIFLITIFIISFLKITIVNTYFHQNFNYLCWLFLISFFNLFQNFLILFKIHKCDQFFIFDLAKFQGFIKVYCRFKFFILSFHKFMTFNHPIYSIFFPFKPILVCYFKYYFKFTKFFK